MRLKHTLKRGVAATVIAGIVVSSGLPVLAETYDIANGSISVRGEGDTRYVSQGDVIDHEETSDTIIIGSSTENTVSISDADVTLSDVTIDASSTGEAAVSASGDVTIELEGDNTLISGSGHAGLESNAATENDKLTITDTDNDGTLNATGGSMAAGIGGGRDNGTNVTIEGGKSITASGGNYAAGIGGGGLGGGSTKELESNVTISGGTLTDIKGGNFGGAGIGGGEQNAKTTVTITGGTIENVKGGTHGAGIGGGAQNEDVTVKISGEDTRINASGNTYGAGIGNGYQGGDTTIEITDGTINSSTITAGAGIGAGRKNTGDVDITISGGKTTATGGSWSAGIGGAESGTGKTTIRITDGTVDATAGSGNCAGAGIGSGGEGISADVTISGGDVTAKANGSGAAIGGGGSSQDTTVSISGGKVDASNKGGGAGIGSGANATGSTTIRITGGEITATAPGDRYSGAAIGGGASAAGTPDITINADDADLTLDVTASGQNGSNYNGAIGKSNGSTGTYDKSVLGEAHKAIVRIFNKRGLKLLWHNNAYVAEDLTENYIPEDDAQKYEHVWVVDDSTPSSEPTCTEDGSISYKCAIDGCTAHKQFVAIPAIGHDWGEWIVTKEATLQEDGSAYRVCKNDPAHTETKVLPKLTPAEPEEVPAETSAPIAESVQAEPRLEVRNLLNLDVMDDKNLVQQSVDEASHTLTIEAKLTIGSLTGSLKNLNALREQGIETIVFTTRSRTSTLVLAELCALGGEDTAFSLAHLGSRAALTVDGAAYDELIH